MTHHDDPDTTTPIDTTTGQAPVKAEPAPLTTERIRMFYTHATAWATYDPTDRPDLVRMRASQGAEFDRWLAAHDAQVAAEARPNVGRDLLAEAEARGYERGKRDALTEAAAAMGHDLLLFAALKALCESSTLADEVQDAAVAWLRARGAETPGGGACVPIYTPGEVEDEENACVTHEGPWPCETPGGAA